MSECLRLCDECVEIEVFVLDRIRLIKENYSFFSDLKLESSANEIVLGE
jgi:hypothetical protein